MSDEDSEILEVDYRWAQGDLLLLSELDAGVNDTGNQNLDILEFDELQTLERAFNGLNKKIVDDVAKADIKKDDIFTEQNLTVMRPGTGLSAMRWDSVIGKNAIKDFKKGDMIVM